MRERRHYLAKRGITSNILPVILVHKFIHVNVVDVTLS